LGVSLCQNDLKKRSNLSIKADFARYSLTSQNSSRYLIKDMYLPMPPLEVYACRYALIKTSNNPRSEYEQLSYFLYGTK